MREPNLTLSRLPAIRGEQADAEQPPTRHVNNWRGILTRRVAKIFGLGCMINETLLEIEESRSKWGSREPASNKRDN